MKLTNPPRFFKKFEEEYEVKSTNDDLSLLPTSSNKDNSE